VYSVLSDFSNALGKQDLKVLAEEDDQEVVREVQVSWEIIGVCHFTNLDQYFMFAFILEMQYKC